VARCDIDRSPAEFYRTKEYAVNEDMTNETVNSNARRRLVRGAFAAPAALTLYSGSVAAASVSCIAKQLTNPITTNGDTTLVRVPLYRLANGANTATFVRQADIASLMPPGGSYLATGQAQCVGITGTGAGFSVGTIYTSPALPNGTMPAITSPIQYVAVRVSATGKIEGVISVPSAGANTALHTSCWTSFGGLVPFNTA